MSIFSQPPDERARAAYQKAKRIHDEVFAAGKERKPIPEEALALMDRSAYTGKIIRGWYMDGIESAEGTAS